MSTIRVQCKLDETVLARIDALKLTPRGRAKRRGGSQQARRELDLVAVVMRGIEAIEAAKADMDTAAPPASVAPTPRTDLPAWMAQTPPTPAFHTGDQTAPAPASDAGSSRGDKQ
jgi:hypothetical protein